MDWNKFFENVFLGGLIVAGLVICYGTFGPYPTLGAIVVLIACMSES